MRVFRLSKKKYSKELSGKGASRSGNRWNSKGTEIIYSAESRALAMAEVAVHLTLATLPSDYVMIEIDIPGNIKIKELKLEDLPDNWNNHPPNISTQKIGDEFIDSLDFCVLKVPSAVVQGDFNYLINPYHKEFKKIKIFDVKEFPFDKRIFK
ncbi:RES family NAD+ phosphorylase [Winogradskyella aquimaris]|uniref:RES family NAD+ phosphorylase n=1 Tax=Winogradskyella aquimaris TaxID=864074 RepID=A0ABU5EQA6_9FLAO|nr:RES family NAD+ phosphorylase [Winogradskyella aquimaris]MDY2588537.1 RES family NAD+ phosphorylase [Winogradskyella aquimaris]